MKVKFGIIGLGGIANRFASAANMVENAQLVAVASRDQKKSDAFVEKYKAKKAYQGYEALAKDPDVDAVYISLTHNFHDQAIRLCLDNGKAVLCEKPMVLTRKNAEELAALAKEKNILLMEAMWTRCIPTTIKATEWVKQGTIGKVKLVNASFCFNALFNPEQRLFNPKLAGGSLYDAGVYPIEFTTGVLAENPSTVKGVATICASGVDEYAAMSLGFDSGALATLSCGLTAQTSNDAYIYGTDGYIVVYQFLSAHKCERYDKHGNLQEVFEDDFKEGFTFEIEHFIDLYCSKRIESPLIPLKDTIACAGIFDTLMAQWGS